MRARWTAAFLVVATLFCAAPANAAPLSQYVRVTLPEVPSSIAVANTGEIVAALYNPQTVALVSPDGEVRQVPVSCALSDVEIDPTGTIAWAVCRDSTLLHVIDVATGSVSVMDLGVTKPVDAVYIPINDLLVVATRSGKILVIGDVSTGGYEIRRIISAGKKLLWRMTLTANGSSGFAITEAGRLLRLDLVKGEVRVVSGFPKDASLMSIALSPRGTALYAGAALGVGDQARPALVRIDPASGRILQSQAIVYTMPYFASPYIAVAKRQMYVATGLGVAFGDTVTGIFSVALDARGRMGATLPVATGDFGAGIALSSDRRQLAVGDTSSEAIGFH